MSDLNTAQPGLLWVMEVEWKRRKGRPVEIVGVTNAGLLQALVLEAEIAARLKIPQSWVKAVLYRRAEREASVGER